MSVRGLGALYMWLNTRFFIQTVSFGDDFEKMQYVGSAAVVSELRLSCASSARQHLHLRVKEGNFTKEKYINTAKEAAALKASSP